MGLVDYPKVAASLRSPVLARPSSSPPPRAAAAAAAAATDASALLFPLPAVPNATTASPRSSSSIPWTSALSRSGWARTITPALRTLPTRRASSGRMPSSSTRQTRSTSRRQSRSRTPSRRRWRRWRRRCAAPPPPSPRRIALPALVLGQTPCSPALLTLFPPLLSPTLLANPRPAHRPQAEAVSALQVDTMERCNILLADIQANPLAEWFLDPVRSSRVPPPRAEPRPSPPPPCLHAPAGSFCRVAARPCAPSPSYRAAQPPRRN